MSEPQLDAWRVFVTPLPGTLRGASAELWRGVVEQATLAPSIHNTQPWRFQVRGGALELRPDLSRALPVTDPLHRQLVVSCGAALENIKLDLACRGIAPRIELLPDPSDPRLLARVQTGGFRPPSLLEQTLRGAIARRRTSRRAFAALPISDSAVDLLRHAAAVEGARLDPVSETDRPAVAALIAEGAREQGNDPAFRGELSTWLRTGAASKGARVPDGVPVESLGIPPVLGRVGIRVLRDLPWGGIVGERERRLALEAPLLAMLCTARDGVRDWLTAGMALQRVLLLAASRGLSAGFMNQPITTPALRERLRDRLAMVSVPQAIVRFGIAGAPAVTPRRPAAEVLTE